MNPVSTPDQTQQLLDDNRYYSTALLGKLFTAPEKLHEADLVELEDLTSHDDRIYLTALRNLDQARGGLTVEDLPDVVEAIAARQHATLGTVAGYIHALRADCFTTANVVNDAIGIQRTALQLDIQKAIQAGDATRIAELVSKLAELPRKASQPPRHNPYQPPAFTPFTDDELTGARLHPTCFIENYLYADLGQVCAAGGTGKSTLFIYEAVCLAIGRDVWGHRVLNPGRTLFITAEDQREIFAARLREIMDAMNLAGHERRLARESICVWDVSGSPCRLAELDQAGNIQITPLPDRIIAAYRDTGLAQIVLDPQVNFHPGERTLNDGDQAMIAAGRKIRNALNCAVRFIHHTGKANARNGASDQYAGRGGTAMPDGCRMVTILNSINGDHPAENPPAGFELAPDETGFILTQGKLSYAPLPRPVWIRRRGFTYEHFTDEHRSQEQIESEDAEKLAAFIAEELLHGRKHTSNTLAETNACRLPRARLRAALSSLQVSGRLLESDLPKEERHGRRKTYLHLIRHSAAIPPTRLAE